LRQGMHPEGDVVLFRWERRGKTPG
jgi:hypothetical protein